MNPGMVPAAKVMVPEYDVVHFKFEKPQNYLNKLEIKRYEKIGKKSRGFYQGGQEKVVGKDRLSKKDYRMSH